MGVRAEGLGRWSLPAARRHYEALYDGAVVLLALAVFVGAVFGAAVGIAATVAPLAEAANRSVQEAKALAAIDTTLAARTKVYAADGTLLAILHGEENREPATLEEIPWHVEHAVRAIEDARFFDHPGVDVRALLRALVVNYKEGAIREGGGTITMQLVRASHLDSREQTLDRKVREMLTAIMLEDRLDKEQILEAYLNTVYFGDGAYGVRAAAETYFGKEMRDLTYSDAAFLASLIRAPEEYNPRADTKRATTEKNRVLRRMNELSLLNDSRTRHALTQKLAFTRRTVSLGIDMIADTGGTFVEHVKRTLLDDPRLGETREDRAGTLFGGGLRVYTTLDPNAQRAGERAAREVLNAEGDPSAALATVEPGTGAVRAMVGGFDDRGFNLAAQGKRQPGSAFKPLALAAAIESGIPLSKRYRATAPRTIRLPHGEDWVVNNYEGAPSRTMSLFDATVFSVNTVYAQVVMETGAAKVARTAKEMGITTELGPYPAIALGGLTTGVSPLELASAYATIANGGVHVPTIVVTRVENAAGEQVLVNEPKPTRAIPQWVAEQVRLTLRAVVAEGTGRRAGRIGSDIHGKTGTTGEYRDSWFAGFNPDLATAVWIGHPDARRPLYNVQGWRRVFGGSLPAEIWTRTMAAALGRDDPAA